MSHAALKAAAVFVFSSLSLLAGCGGGGGSSGSPTPSGFGTTTGTTTSGSTTGTTTGGTTTGGTTSGTTGGTTTGGTTTGGTTTSGTTGGGTTTGGTTTGGTTSGSTGGTTTGGTTTSGTTTGGTTTGGTTTGGTTTGGTTTGGTTTGGTTTGGTTGGSTGGSSGGTTGGTTGVVLQSIQITPANRTLPVNYSQAYSAVGVYSDASTKNLTSLVTWTVDAPTASISAAGVLATGSTAAKTTVRASYGGVAGSTPLTVAAGQLQSIAIDPSTATIEIGQVQQFTATGYYVDSLGNASTYDLSSQPAATAGGSNWTSSTTGVASISAQGLATGIAAGSSTIGFTYQGVTASTATVTVPAAPPTTGSQAPVVTIDQADPVTLYLLPCLNSTQLTATGFFADGSTVDPLANVTWQLDAASDIGIVTVDAATGRLTAQRAGAAIVDVVYNGAVQDSINVSVSAVTLSSIAVTPAAVTIPLGVSTPFAATGTLSDGSTTDLTTCATWTVANPSVASISNDAGSATTAGTQGLATAIAAGTTQVTATAGGVAGSATLTVSPATLSSIQIAPAGTSTLPVGYSRQFTATGTYSDGSSYPLTGVVTWTSDAPMIASASNAGATKGLVTAYAVGVANIRANLGAVQSASTQLTTSNATLTAITVTPSNATMKSGDYLQFHATGTFSDGSTGLDLTTQVSWSVTKAKHIVTISNRAGSKGLAHASVNTKKTGTVTIKASKSGITSAGVMVSKTS